MQLQLSTAFTALDLAPFVKTKVKSSAAICVNWSPGSFLGQSTYRLEEKDYSQKPGESTIHIHTMYTWQASITFPACSVCQRATPESLKGHAVGQKKRLHHLKPRQMNTLAMNRRGAPLPPTTKAPPRQLWELAWEDVIPVLPLTLSRSAPETRRGHWKMFASVVPVHSKMCF